MSKAKKMKLILVIISISFIQGLQYCVSPVLKQIQSYHFGVDVSLVQMLITAPSLLAMLISLLSGWLVIKISKKKLLLFACLLSGITGFLPFLSDSFGLLFGSRIMYGVGLGIATTLNTAVVAEFFEGDERVSVMGIQAASIGAGMVLITSLGGVLGAADFRYAYFTNIIGFISLLIIAVCLPETGTAKETEAEKIEINKEVLKICILGMLEFLFLITFTTNIAMHLQGMLAGDSAASGTLTGIFSAAQIVMGFVLGVITRRTGKYTLSVAMLSFCVGGIVLILFPQNLILLMVGAACCGFSQGIFIPTAMVAVSNAVKPVATAMASACFTCAMCIGQLISPYVLNTTAKAVMGEASTGNVYMIAVIGMFISAVIAAFWMKKEK